MAGILDAPLIGHGYIFGPRGYEPIWSISPGGLCPMPTMTSSMQALPGGIGAAVLTAMIFVRVGYGVLTMDRSASEKAPMVAVYIQLTAYAMMTPLLSSAFGPQGIILICSTGWRSTEPIRSGASISHSECFGTKAANKQEPLARPVVLGHAQPAAKFQVGDPGSVEWTATKKVSLWTHSILRV